MKITDETKTFTAGHIFGTHSLGVSSNMDGTHENPSVFLHIQNPIAGEDAAFGTDDPEQIKEIIEHMAKMAGLDVAFSQRFEPKYQPGDRIRSTMEDHKGSLGTVLHDKEHIHGWNVRVRLDGEPGTGLFMYEELEPVTKSAVDTEAPID